MKVLRIIRWVLGSAILLPGVAAVLVAAIFGARFPAMRLWCCFALWVFGIKAVRHGPPPPPGSFVAMNHLNYFDPIVSGALCPAKFIAKKEIAGWMVAGWVARAGGTIFIDRTSARSSHGSIDDISQTLKKGERIVVFAEGGIRGTPKEVAPFMPMLFTSALRVGAPVVPASLRYYVGECHGQACHWEEGSLTDHLFGKFLAADSIKVEVRFGEPIAISEGETRKTLSVRARDEVQRLLEMGEG